MGKPLLAAVALLTAAVGTAAAVGPQYSQIAAWSAPNAGWDYASVDATARRLYVGRFGGVLAIDLKSGAITWPLIKSSLVHGVAPLPGGLAAASNGEANTVTIFDGNTGRLIFTVPAGAEPDGIIYEPKFGLVTVTDGDGNAISLIDPRKGVLVAKIKLGGSPEAVAADGRGFLYDNIDDINEVAVIDVAKRAVVKLIPLPGCDSPTGMAFDRILGLAVSVCRNGVVNVIRASDRTVATTLKLAPGPDTAMIDPGRGVAIVPAGGGGGALEIIALRKNGVAWLQQSVPTEGGTRTGAVDPVTGKVYLPAAVLTSSPDPRIRHILKPGTFRILVYAPQ